MADFDPDAYLAAMSPTDAPSTPQQSFADMFSNPPQSQHPVPSNGIAASDFDPDQYLKDLNEEKYGTLPQIGLTALEGAGQGFAGPAATLAEKGLSKMGVPGLSDEDIRLRHETNPITHGVTEAGGLGVGLITGTGEAAVMTKAGQIAREAAGLANVAREAPIAFRIGSEAVQQAAEMAILQSGSEASKMLLNDPEASAESAIANIGMSAALGGAGGAAMAGVVSPIWHATAGPKVEALLQGITNRINGTALAIPEHLDTALNTLGVETTPEIRAAMSGNAGAVDKFNVLKEVQNKEVLAGLDKLNTDTSNAVMNSLGVAPHDIENYSENEAGHKLQEVFQKEYDREYKPLAEAFDRRNTEAAGITIGDEAKMGAYAKLIEDGMQKVGTDSPYYKEYNDLANRLLAKDNIGQLDQLKTEINNRIKGLRIGGDHNIINALGDIKNTITDFQEDQIGKAAMASEKLGVKGAQQAGEELVAERQLTNQRYAEFAKMSDELTSHLGVGKFHGAGTLKSKLADQISPEDLLKKFSFRNNADFIQFLSKNFPETLKEVQANELKKFIKPAVLGAKGEAPLNVKKLQDIINKSMAGQREYVESVLPRGAKEAVDAAASLQNAIPSPKSSGTAGWMTKTMAKMPQSALAAVAMLTAHNPLFGYLTGEMAQHLGRTAPDAINLAYLKFLGSNQPIKAGAFKSMVEFMHNTIKGQNMLSKATSAMFESGAKILSTNLMPAKADLEKLDKQVTKLQENPGKVMALNQGELGHYLPDHQTGLTEASTRALGYLQSIKPQPFKPSPLDKPIDPSKAEMARYNRALEIAQQPAVVLQHVKDGTIQANDIKDLGAMYPGLYKKMAGDLSIKMTDAASKGIAIPYKTKIGLSLFLGQPLDTTMTPSSIQSAQSVFMPKSGTQLPNMGSQQPKSGNLDKLGKNIKSYQTPNQASESRRMNHK